MMTIKHRQIILRGLTFFTIVIVYGQMCFGQTAEVITETKKNAENFIKLPEGIIKSEIASFYKTAYTYTKTDSFSTIKLNEISFYNCSDSTILFIKKGILVDIHSSVFDTTGHSFLYSNSSRPVLIQIDSKPFWGTHGKVPNRKIASIIFQHEKYQLTLPDSAVTGLYEPNFCTQSKRDVLCKVFRSLDNRRIYIYMLNSDGAGAYEVTWVIQDSKYLTRVIDYVP